MPGVRRRLGRSRSSKEERSSFEGMKAAQEVAHEVEERTGLVSDCKMLKCGFCCMEYGLESSMFFFSGFQNG